MIKLRPGRTGRALRLGGAAALALALAGSLGIGSASAAAGRASAPARCAGPTVAAQPFGSDFDIYTNAKLPVVRYTLTNCRGMQVRVLSYGGIIQSIEVPGRGGREADVVLGF